MKESVLPAHAGMIPHYNKPLTCGNGAPRACGDDPAFNALKRAVSRFEGRGVLASMRRL